MRQTIIDGQPVSIHWAAITTLIYSEEFSDKTAAGTRALLVGDPFTDFQVAGGLTMGETYPFMAAMKFLWAELKTVNPSTPSFREWLKKNPDLMGQTNAQGKGWPEDAMDEAFRGLFPFASKGADVVAEEAAEPAQ